MGWFKNLGKAPQPVKPLHPSHHKISSLVNVSKGLEKEIAKIWAKTHGLGYTDVDYSGSEHKGERHIRVRTSRYFHSRNGKMDISGVPEFFQALMHCLEYPPIHKYDLNKKEHESMFLCLRGRDRDTITLAMYGENILLNNPVEIVIEFSFLSANTVDEFNTVLSEVKEIVEGYYQNPVMFKIENIVRQVRKEIESETQHQRENEGRSAAELQAASE